MKLFLALLGFSIFGSAFADDIDFVCHCVGDCVRETKCDGAFESYLKLVKSGSNELQSRENEFLKSHELASLEFVDWGTSYCGTIFGMHNTVGYRMDFEFVGNKLAKSALAKLPSLPTLDDRMVAKSDDLCLFTL
ncbi:hypothetical protein [Arsukibacterium perlucidum]|uniref:hypothetical protein n=1 Tax=Arsukibacterium perlucidum TaxID=368811 RepID=UPI0003743C53|nr:hypothetical protein [Arsukibacterium perlucidum]